MLVSTEIISMDDNVTVLDLFDDPKYMEDNPVNRTITVIVDEGSPSTELHTSTENPKSTKPIDFFDTEVGIAVLTIICLLIAYNVHYRTMSNLLWDKVIIDIRGVAITLPQK